MTDPVARVAKRQNLLDELAEHLTTWGCPPDSTSARAHTLLLLVEARGWQLPAVPVPPIRGGGSTDEGRARARRIIANTRAGCTCGDDQPGPLAAAALVGRLLAEHPPTCPARIASEPPQDGATSPLPSATARPGTGTPPEPAHAD